VRRRRIPGTPIVRRRRSLYVVRAMDVEIKPNPTEAERTAILLALEQEAEENPVLVREIEDYEE